MSVSGSSKKSRINQFDSYASDSSAFRVPRSKSPKKKRARSALIREEHKELVHTLKLEAQEMQRRIATESPLTYQTRVDFAGFINKINDQASLLVQARDFTAASTLYKVAIALLKSDAGARYPDLKFATYKNLAHAHNLQGNVRLCVSNLIKALNFGLKMDDMEEYDVFAHLKSKIPIVETYINICNAYSSQGLNQDAVDYISGAVVMSQKLMDIAYLRIQSAECGDEEKDALNRVYVKLIELNVIAYQTRGKLSDKFKKYHDALGDFLSARKVIEANYGLQHSAIAELDACINTTKLHLRLAKGGNAGPIVIGPHRSLDTQGSQRSQAKPVRIVRGSLVKPKREDTYQHYSNASLEPIQQPRKVSRVNLRNFLPQARPSVSSLALDRKQLSDSKKNRLAFEIEGVHRRLRPLSAKRAAVGEQHSSHTCVNYQEQIAKLQEMHIEQTKMITQILQQQQNLQNMTLNRAFSESQNQLGSLQTPSSAPTAPQMPYHPFYPFYAPPPMPYGFPPQMPGAFPQTQAGFPYPYPQPYPNPYMNLGFPGMNPAMPAPMQPYTNQVSANLPPKRNSGRQHAKRYNEDEAPAQPSFPEVTTHIRNPSQDHVTPQAPQMQQPQQAKPSRSAFLEKFKQPAQPSISSPPKLKAARVFSQDEQEKAAVKIQSHFRRFKAQKEYKQVAQTRVSKQRIIQQLYHLKADEVKGHQNTLLSVNLELPRTGKPTVHAMIYNQLKKRVVFEARYGTQAFGFGMKGEKANPSRDEVVVRVKSIIGHLNLTGNPKVDFSEFKLLEAYENSKKKQVEHIKLQEQHDQAPSHRLETGKNDDVLLKQIAERKAEAEKKLKEQQDQAATKIQARFRGYQARKHVQELKEFKQSKQKFMQQAYRYQVEGSIKDQIGLMTAQIELAWVKEGKKQVSRPKQVIIQVFNQLQRKIVFSVTHQLKVFGYEKEDLPNKDEVVVRVKSLVQLLKLKGDLMKDFSEKRFKRAYKHSKIPEAERRDSSSSDEEKMVAKKGPANAMLQPHMAPPKPKEASPKKSVKFEDQVKSEGEDSIIEDIYDNQESPVKEQHAEVQEKPHKEERNEEPTKEEQKEKKKGKKEKKEKNAKTPKKQGLDEEQERLLIKAQACIRGHLVRQQYSCKADADMCQLSTRVKKYDDDIHMAIFLFGRLRAPKAGNQIAYKVVLRDLSDIKNVHTLQVPYLEAQSMLYSVSCPSVKGGHQMAHFNKDAAMLECLLSSVKQKDDQRVNFFVDFKKFAQKAGKLIEGKKTKTHIQTHKEPKQVPPKQEKPADNVDKKVVKAQALVRGHLVRQQYKDQLKAEFKTLSSSVKRINDEIFNLFLMGRVSSNSLKGDEVCYRVIVRDVKDLNYKNQIAISFKEASDRLFSGAHEKLSMATFNKNPRILQSLIESVVSADNKTFSIDFERFAKLSTDHEAIALVDLPAESHRESSRVEQAESHAQTFMKLPTIGQSSKKFEEPERAITPPIESDVEEDFEEEPLKTGLDEEEKQPQIVVSKAPEPAFVKKPTQREDVDLVRKVQPHDAKTFLLPPAIEEKEERDVDTSMLKTDPHETEEVDATKFVVNNEEPDEDQFVEEDLDDEEDQDQAVSELEDESETHQARQQPLEASQPLSALSGQSGALEVAELETQQIEVGPLLFIVQIMGDVNGRFIIVAVAEDTSQKVIIQDKMIALQPDDEETQLSELAALFMDAFGEAVTSLVLDQESGGIQEDWAENLYDFISNEF